MMKRSLFGLLFLIVLIMGGCGNEEQPADEEIEFCFRFSLGKDGILYCGSLLYITDYATGVTVPLCDKPNCAHEPQSSTNENPQCNAAYSGGIETAFIYQDKLYVFVRDGLNHTTVYMSENTGEGRRKLGEADFTWDGFMQFQNGKLYFSAERESYQEDKSLLQEKEIFLGLFDTDSRHFEILTTPDKSLRGMNLCGVTEEEIFYTQYRSWNDKRDDWTSVSVDYLAKNFVTGEERFFLEGEDIVNHIEDFRVVRDEVYYTLNKDGAYEYWKRESDGREILLYSADQLRASYNTIVNGEVLLEKDKSDFQKGLTVLGTCGDIIFVTDGRNGGRHGIITTDNYINDVDEIIYPEFPNMIYIGSE